MQNIKTIAFYLPQFHTIPENDESFGKGFTEWTNVKKAIPLFDGHNQPRIPLNNDYYCLLDEGVMKNQAELAKKYGVYGFCYYHYWFKDGKKLLEKPLENMLADKSIDIPFCLCWANENWTKKWDGGNNEVIVQQDYGDFDDLLNHIDYLCDFLKDERYIRINGKPLLIIYKPDLIPGLKKYVKLIRDRILKNGIGEIALASQYPKFFEEGVNLNLFDYYIQFQPRFVPESMANDNRNVMTKQIKKIMIRLGLREFGKGIRNLLTKKQTATLEHRSYEEDWEYILNYKVSDERLLAGAFIDWDNTPRNRNGLVYDGTSPELFGKFMKRLVYKVRKEYKEPFIFINAWNEWAEGTYLEPDCKYGYKYLEQLKKAIDS